MPGRKTVSVLNADDERVARFADFAPGRVITFGVAKSANFRAEEIEDRGADGSAFTFISPQGTRGWHFRLLDVTTSSNALAALTAASEFGIAAAEAAEVLPRMKPATMRGEILHFEDGLTVINDCYNSSPTAMSSMLELLGADARNWASEFCRWRNARAGSIFRGIASRSGTRAARHRLDWIIAVQGEAAEMMRAAVRAGYSEAQTRFFANSSARQNLSRQSCSRRSGSSEGFTRRAYGANYGSDSRTAHSVAGGRGARRREG